jgi:DNA-binding response OmpR family regulator
MWRRTHESDILGSVLIAVIEDDRGLAEFLDEGLRSEGWSVVVSGDGTTGLAAAKNEHVSLVILDLGLPRMDGSEVLRRLRALRPNLPVIVLTARDAVSERVRLLDLGADDYLVKPFALSELIARVRARLRQESASARTLTAGSISMDLVARRAMRDGAEVQLTAREFALLETFIRHRGQVLSQSQLMSQVWGLDAPTSSNVVEVYVSYLRRKFGSATISTVRGAGYRFDT